MAGTQEPAAARLRHAERPYWSQVLRALREARGVTRDRRFLQWRAEKVGALVPAFYATLSAPADRRCP
jgi:hypothetical protein